ncbi:hypothetical protein CRENBAI_021386 [Crenichthys baileyi]|uniref:Uncharacterized protein n=1 Tax=Crenichthys baileyi TaxID=28760 RepID=A0AAV9SGT3_9TELE
MCACLHKALIAARCTATAAKRPQCGCDTCQGEEVGGEAGAGELTEQTERWEKGKERGGGEILARETVRLVLLTEEGLLVCSPASMAVCLCE